MYVISKGTDTIELLTPSGIVYGLLKGGVWVLDAGMLQVSFASFWGLLEWCAEQDSVLGNC